MFRIVEALVSQDTIPGLNEAMLVPKTQPLSSPHLLHGRMPRDTRVSPDDADSSYLGKKVDQYFWWEGE